MTKPNYQLKAYVLNERKDLLDNVKSISKAKWHAYKADEQHNEIVLNYWLEVEKELLENDALYYNEALKLNKANLNRVVRLKNRIHKYMNMGNCLFLTLTFTDKVLENTSADTRRQYVRKWLKKHSSYYVANIDYGKTTGREHYHAVIKIDYLEENSFPYGYIGIREIRTPEDYKALAKYLSKLTNHAIKKTTNRSAVIYGEP